LLNATHQELQVFHMQVLKGIPAMQLAPLL
jgi:hypothetical protein